MGIIVPVLGSLVQNRPEEYQSAPSSHGDIESMTIRQDFFTNDTSDMIPEWLQIRREHSFHPNQVRIMMHFSIDTICTYTVCVFVFVLLLLDIPVFSKLQ